MVLQCSLQDCKSYLLQTDPLKAGKFNKKFDFTSVQLNMHKFIISPFHIKLRVTGEKPSSHPPTVQARSAVLGELSGTCTGVTCRIWIYMSFILFTFTQLPMKTGEDH